MDYQQIHRMTDDQYYLGPSSLSVNLWVIREKLPPMMYGFVLSLSINFINSLCLHFPGTKISTGKIYMDAAYKRCSPSNTTAYECLTIFDRLFLMALPMTFGGSLCPSLWNLMPETMDVQITPGTTTPYKILGNNPQLECSTAEAGVLDDKVEAESDVMMRNKSTPLGT